MVRSNIKIYKICWVSTGPRCKTAPRFSIVALGLQINALGCHYTPGDFEALRKHMLKYYRFPKRHRSDLLRTPQLMREGSMHPMPKDDSYDDTTAATMMDRCTWKTRLPTLWARSAIGSGVEPWGCSPMRWAAKRSTSAETPLSRPERRLW